MDLKNEHLEEVLSSYFRVDDKKLKSMLLEQGYISEEDLREGEKHAKDEGVSFVDFLLKEGLITKTLLGQALAEFHGVPYANLRLHPPSKDDILKIPEDVAKKHRVVVYQESGGNIIVATDNIQQEKLQEDLSGIFPDKEVYIAYTLPEYIDEAFVSYRKPLSERFSKIIKEKESVAPEILYEVIDEALTNKASDIHIEPRDGKVLVRFRIDGVLHKAGYIPEDYYKNILNRVKTQGNLRIDEHYAAQDGSMQYEHNNETLDVRISIAPTVEGEKIVLRLLASYLESLELADLGLSEKNKAIIERQAKKPFGMIIVSGPTGSGKTTTLYSLLRKINRPNVNITTIEDPVEYKTKGMNQIQVNPESGLTFAKGLRSMVRQDPDIILVGEIRDDETAEISVNAALTGHLLFSTFHSNDAATTVPRLLDMKTKPFLLASTLELIIAQRLVRKICSNCIRSISAEEASSELKGLKVTASEGVTLYKGKGCGACNDTGYKGRTGIFELIQITPEMKELILKNPSTKEVWDLAKIQGAQSLFEDGLEKVNNGETTIGEVVRVAPRPYEE